MTKIFRHLVCLGILVMVGSNHITYAQTESSPSSTTAAQNDERCEPNDKIWQKSSRSDLVPVTQATIQRAGIPVESLAQCDSQQTFILKRGISPWRIGLYAGPNTAWCGSWDGTFGAVKRDNSLYNGIGFHLSTNVDYFFPTKSRFRFGLGGALGYQNFFARREYKDYLLSLATQLSPSGSPALRNRPSEDFFLVVGPVVTFDLKKGSTQTCSSFLELALRGGVYRSEAALVGAYLPNENNQLVRMVMPGDRLYQPGGNLSLGAYFPLRNNWYWGVQAQGFITRQQYFIINGVQDQLFEFRRSHGGFNAGLGLRKGFQERKVTPVKVECPSCTETPVVTFTYAGAQLNGTTLPNSVLASGFQPTLHWQNVNNDTINYEYQTQLYYQGVVPGATQAVLVKEQSFAQTRQFEPLPNDAWKAGYYFMTVQMRKKTPCGTLLCGFTTTSFAIKDTCAQCRYVHRFEPKKVYYKAKWKDVIQVCYCDTREVNAKTIRRPVTRSLELSEPMTVDTLDNSRLHTPEDIQKLYLVERPASTLIKGKKQPIQDTYITAYEGIYTVEELCEDGKPVRIASYNLSLKANHLGDFVIDVLRPHDASLIKAPLKLKPSEKPAPANPLPAVKPTRSTKQTAKKAPFKAKK
ncbi:hypothetical protein [Tellurirhabdus bombi]|uniref:hypothetical protein n=1 Tax=Tellurirhabdus bombi TaxID=2907205 RepID=UPI001F24DDF6|nr:hypothetical protein [Tellurirhabdus bombi]